MCIGKVVVIGAFIQEVPQFRLRGILAVQLVVPFYTVNENVVFGSHFFDGSVAHCVSFLPFG